MNSEVFRPYSKSEKTDSEFIANIVPFEGIRKIISFKTPGKMDLPQQIYFQANFKLLHKSDYPTNNVDWPIMSKRMYNILLSCGDFPHKTYPVIMVDDTIPWEERTDKNGNIREDIINTDYVAIQITEYTDIFDYDNSLYTRDILFPDEIGVITKLVLKSQKNSLPPLMIMKEKSSTLLMSHQAKTILVNQGITGIDFIDQSKPL